MKIGQTPEPGPGVNPPAKRPGPETEAAAQAKAAAVRTPAASGASVSVSTLGRTLEATRRADAGDIDQAKVDEIKAAIADGSYQINPEAIADKMLANAQEMLQPKGGVTGH
ncbi:flagellar biosynthesis anti-sigma factor FlgM [Pseudorhodoferax sp.]|uniref:flagellar biosynthesis anti-sigma factor FlgM n=1 Tax=Pseudorhodoferax sp. TaxID=1993553 RepID=UPI002DD64E79|nr:flagellar biosynthesis anti-sigma factor FlgM [Pseudorhodoferax sp.]